MKHAFLILTFLLAGCGVPPSHARRENVEPMELRKFPRQNWRLVNNRVFLWKEDMVPAEVSAVLSISRDIDRLDGEAIPLNRRSLTLENQIEPLKKPVKRFTSTMKTAKKQHEDLTKELTNVSKTLIETQTTLDAENVKTPPDAGVVLQLSLKVAGLTAQQESLKKQEANLKTLKEILEKNCAGGRGHADAPSRCGCPSRW